MAHEPDESNALEGDLGTVTDEEWLAAHQRLIASGDLPPEETRFLYEPGRDPSTVTADDLTDDGVPRG